MTISHAALETINEMLTKELIRKRILAFTEVELISFSNAIQAFATADPWKDCHEFKEKNLGDWTQLVALMKKEWLVIDLVSWVLKYLKDNKFTVEQTSCSNADECQVRMASLNEHILEIKSSVSSEAIPKLKPRKRQPSNDESLSVRKKGKTAAPVPTQVASSTALSSKFITVRSDAEMADVGDEKDGKP